MEQFGSVVCTDCASFIVSPNLFTFRENSQSDFPSPDQNIAETSRLQSWLSFAYTEKAGVYMSVYFHSSDSYPWSEN